MLNRSKLSHITRICCWFICLYLIRLILIILQIDWLSMVLPLRLHQHNMGYIYGRRFLQVWWPNQQCQSTEGGWLVIQTGLSLTRLTSPCYNMHADIIQENNLTHTQSNPSTVTEPSEMKPNLGDKTCELLKWVCNYRKLHNTTTREQFWQYSLLLLTKP